MYIVVDDPLVSAIKLNTELSRIDMWQSMWVVTFNPFKSESLTFSRKVNKSNHPPNCMNDQEVNSATLHGSTTIRRKTLRRIRHLVE